MGRSGIRPRKRRPRRRPGRRGGRVDISRGVHVPGTTGRFYDPPWRSIPEGRGLPYTPLIRAMLPVMVLLAMAVLIVVAVLAGISVLLG